MSKESALLAKATIEICNKRCYKVSNKLINFSDKLLKCMQNTKYISSAEVNRDLLNYVANNFTNYTSKTVYEVTHEKTVEALLRINNEKSSSDKVGILNFASAHHPGGGFVSGAMAQEECLCLCSGLYHALTTDEASKFYQENSTHIHADYTDAMIYSENVPFIRDEDFSLLDEPVYASVLTSPAINRHTLQNSTVTWPLLPQFDEVMVSRMQKVLVEFVKNNCDTLILGAFGCGVFGNDPKVIARAWKDMLVGGNLDKYFKKVVFAIYDREPNGACFQAFKSVWNTSAKII